MDLNKLLGFKNLTHLMPTQTHLFDTIGCMEDIGFFIFLLNMNFIKPEKDDLYSLPQQQREEENLGYKQREG